MYNKKYQNKINSQIEKAIITHINSGRFDLTIRKMIEKNHAELKHNLINEITQMIQNNIAKNFDISRQNIMHNAFGNSSNQIIKSLMSAFRKAIK